MLNANSYYWDVCGLTKYKSDFLSDLKNDIASLYTTHSKKEVILKISNINKNFNNLKLYYRLLKDIGEHDYIEKEVTNLKENYKKAIVFHQNLLARNNINFSKTKKSNSYHSLNYKEVVSNFTFKSPIPEREDAVSKPYLEQEIANSKNRNHRNKAFQQLYTPYIENYERLSYMMIDFIRDNYQTNNITFQKDIIYQVISGTKEHIYLLERLLTIKKEFLQVTTLEPYDLPFYINPSEKIDIEKAFYIIHNSVKFLGDEITKNIDKGLKEGRFDILPKKEKYPGAYCVKINNNIGSYLLTNYHSDLDSLFTLAHEIGHYISNDLDDGDRKVITILSEVNAIVTELIVLKYLLNNANTIEEKGMYIEYYIEFFRENIFSQVMFTEFEIDIHTKIPNTAYFEPYHLKELYKQHLRNYYINTNIENSEEAFGFLRIPHLFTPFYSFNYSLAFLLGIEIVNNLLIDKRFLKKYVISLRKISQYEDFEDFLKDLNIEINNETIKKSFSELSSLINDFEFVLNKN
ncbi:M3 family metallopeptidase [Saliterribacillus persicus]|uniref:Oligoendopeptidase F n=1 Tax=Saliterribacillus persicus TaxID=930114 RepID=A0A368XD57_9BACI|nr:M3 family metallopeptidase [Saliterribacillus persicus]RCW65901.1 oligoendopeptidase F [Saliterribacillus persicus]